MTYEPPITMTTEKATSKIAEGLDNQIVGEVLKIGINVDKDELIKALKYDREQYEKGYEDGYIDGAKNGAQEIFEIFKKNLVKELDKRMARGTYES